MSITVNPTAIQNLAAQNGGRAIPPIGAPSTMGFIGRYLFAATLIAGALAQDANAADLTLVANCVDPNLRRNVGFTQNQPQTYLRAYAFRVSFAPDPATNIPIAEDAKRVMQEQLMLVTGPAGAPRFSPLGYDAGDAYPSRGTSAATTVAATTVDRHDGFKLPGFRRIQDGGDFIDLSSDILAVRAIIATTLVACRMWVEIIGEAARRGSVDWSREGCPLNATQRVQLDDYVRQVFPMPIAA